MKLLRTFGLMCLALLTTNPTPNIGTNELTIKSEAADRTYWFESYSNPMPHSSTSLACSLENLYLVIRSCASINLGWMCFGVYFKALDFLGKTNDRIWLSVTQGKSGRSNKH